MPFFGYRVVKGPRLSKKKHELYELEIVEEEAAVVRIIFEKYAYEGYGAQRIATYLNNARYPTRSGKPWHHATIRCIICNLTYTGVLRCGESRSELLPHLRIISQELYDAAQEARLSRAGNNEATFVPRNGGDVRRCNPGSQEDDRQPHHPAGGCRQGLPVKGNDLPVIPGFLPAGRKLVRAGRIRKNAPVMGAKIAKCEICFDSAPMACKPKWDKTAKKAKENRLPKKAVYIHRNQKSGGDKRDRTADLLNAIQALSPIMVSMY